MKNTATENDLSAALRGNPSFVWRAGQERRLAMIRRWARVEGARVLVNGCGVGIYVRALQVAGASQVHGLDIERERVAEARDNAPGACLCVATCEHRRTPTRASI